MLHLKWLHHKKVVDKFEDKIHHQMQFYLETTAKLSRQYSFSFQKPSVFKNCSKESPKVGSPRPLFPTIFGALPSIAAGDAPRLYIQTKSCTSEFRLSEPMSSFANTSDYEKLSYEFCQCPLPHPY